MEQLSAVAVEASDSDGRREEVVQGDVVNEDDDEGEGMLQFTQQDGAVVALPGGVLWSAPAFQSELIRITGGAGAICLSTPPPQQH